MANTWNQVKLTRKTIAATIEKTCWIEAEYAHLGWRVSLEDEPLEADKIVVWKVSEVGVSMTSDKLNDQERAHRVFDKKLDVKLKRNR